MHGQIPKPVRLALLGRLSWRRFWRYYMCGRRWHRAPDNPTGPVPGRSLNAGPWRDFPIAAKGRSPFADDSGSDIRGRQR
jgi:hypothetical protein